MILIFLKLIFSLNENNILYLSDTNWSFILKKIPSSMILVQIGLDERYRISSDFISMSSTIKNKCFLALIDGDRNPNFVNLVKQKNSKGYYFFRYDKLTYIYRGSYKSDDIIKFINQKTGIPFNTFDDYSSIQEFIDSNKLSVILYEKKAGGPIFNLFQNISYQLRDSLSFGFCPDSDITYELRIKNIPSLVLYKLEDKSKIIYPNSLINNNSSNIIEWINNNLKPNFETFLISNQNYYFNKGPIILFFIPVEEELRDKTLRIINQISIEFKNQFIFTQIDAVTGNRFMQSIGFNKYADPTLSILIYTNKLKYKYLFNETQFNKFLISNFLKQYLNNSLKPFIKSSNINNNIF